MLPRRLSLRRSVVALISAVVASVVFLAPSPIDPATAQAAEPDFAVPFRCGETWYGRTYAGHGYQGTDYPLDFNHLNSAFEASAPVVASAGGTVSIADFDGWNFGYGNYIVIDHGGGWTSLYAHLAPGSRRVSPGASVARGAQLALVGQSGNAQGAHLHFEQRLNGSEAHVRFHGSLIAYSYSYPGNPFHSDNCGGSGTPDDDGDGVPDSEDPCPADAGGNNGCPELATQRIHGDFNGDGLEDAVVPHRRPSNGGLNLWMLASTGAGFEAPALWSSNPAGFLYLSHRPIGGDFNGDGLDDLILAHRRAASGGLNLWFFESTGKGFEAPVLWADGPAGFLYDSSRLSAGDFTGDGLDDVLVDHERASDGGMNLWVFASTGNSLAAPSAWAQGPEGFSFDAHRLQAGDFNGDGRDDALVVHRRSSNGGVNLWVFPSAGSGFGQPQLWADNPTGFDYFLLRPGVADYNGDGEDDVLLAHKRTSDGGVNFWVLSTTGTAFSAPSAWASDPSGFAYDTLRFSGGDLNGDGLDDLVVVHRRNSNGGINVWAFRSSGSGFLAPSNWLSNPSGFSYDQSGVL